MKKLSKYMFIIILSLFIIPIISVNVNAATLDIKTINASITNNIISVDGTVNNGVLAVAIMVYEEDGTTLVKMETTSVDSNDKYSDIIDVTAGKKYIVKAANYDGGAYVTAEVDGTVNNSKNNTNNENSNNSNNIKNEILNNSNNNTTNTETSNKVDNTTNPKTGDNIIVFSIIFVIALTEILVTFIINKKRVKNNK